MNKSIVLGMILSLGIVGTIFVFFNPFQASLSLRLTGFVEIQEVRLGSKVGGRVAQVLVEEGMTVSPGQPLVIFEVPELEALRRQLLAKLEGAQAEYTKALNGARPEERQAAQAAAEAAQARYQKLKKGFREEEIRQAASEWKRPART